MKKKILFVCIENSARSQMAEAFFRKYTTSEFEPLSAGTKPGFQINPMVVQVMKEIGINLQSNVPKPISKEIISNSTKIINMGCIDQESCPSLLLQNVIDWQIPDPKGKSIEEVRIIRDTIELKVKEFVSNLN